MVARDIDEVLQYLDRIIAEYREQRSRLAFFPALYRAVTLRVRAAILNGDFADGERMNRLDTAFANRYFAALASLRAGEPPARCWRIAFGAEARSGTMILQHLLLGMNAHINYDLPIATIAVAASPELADLKDDFMRINHILSATLEDVQPAVGEFSPLLDVLDRIGGRSDEAFVTFSIVHAREEAWHEATRLADELGPRRERSILSLDRRVTLLAERIVLPGGPCGAAIELIAETEQDDVRVVTDGLLSIG
jgi:uncharacterized protein DUF5995